MLRDWLRWLFWCRLHRCYGVTDTEAKGQAEAVEGLHDWFTYGRLQWECCRKCGIVRRLDGKNSPCRGVVKVELRSAPSGKEQGGE